MFEELKDKAVLITGASTGIGAAAAVAFGRLGAHVAVHYNASREAAEGVAAEIDGSGGNAMLVQGDMSDGPTAAKVVEQAIAAAGRLDVLVNNAGHMVDRIPVDGMDDDAFDRVVDLNARSAVAAIRAAVPQFRRQGRGNVINVSSVSARTGGSTGSILYSAAKGFVSTMTHGLAKELAPDNIRVNAVSPGVILTAFHEKYSSPEKLESQRKIIPMGRLGTADDCVGAFLFLATDALSGYITGQIIEVNGGQIMP